MSQPTRFVPNADYSADVVPGDLGNALDTDLDDLQQTTDEICDNLALLQRDDGGLNNGIVEPDSLSTDTVALLSDWTVRGVWLTATAYSPLDFVTNSGIGYLCLVEHVSGTFATDLATGKWTALSKADSASSAFTLTLLDETSDVNWLTALGFSALAQALRDDANTAAMLTTLGMSAAVQSVLDDASIAAMRATLGSTTVGDAVFIAASAAAARTAIDSPSNAEAVLKTGGTMTGALTLPVGGGSGTAGAEGVANVNVTAVGNVGGGDDNLMSYTIPANSLNANNRGFRVKAWGATANNANAKVLSAKFGGNGFGTFTLTPSILGRWSAELIVIRTASNVQVGFMQLHESSGSALAAQKMVIGGGGFTQTDSGTIAMTFVANAVADNDITQAGMVTEFF